MKLHAGGLTGLLLDLDLRQPGYEADFLERFSCSLAQSSFWSSRRSR